MGDMERALGWTWSLYLHALLWAGACWLVFYPPHQCPSEDVALLPKRAEISPSYPVTMRPRDLVEWPGDSGSDRESLRAGFTHRGPDGSDRESEFVLPSRSATELAVTAALFWLARHQKSDGSWGASGICRCRDDGDPGFDHRLTALALLAFRRAGYSEEGGLLFGPVMKKAALWLDARRGNGTEEQFPFEALREARWVEKGTLLSIQKTEFDGCEDGSWDLSADRWALEGGRAYATALNALVLLAR
jgi:hypothetical protein